MAKRIAALEAGGIAEQLGLREGDVLFSINGEAVLDTIDYQALTYETHIELSTSRGDFSFDKEEYEPLGVWLEADGVRLCVNHCPFCFVDQLPPHVRESMRVKDDDWRQSLIMGNFVTLTNVYGRELDRIIRRGASPLYISVHATRPELRRQLLGCARGGEILDTLSRLKEGGISYHLQAVLCPGLNDGTALEETIADLWALRPAALSLALVPVGLTKFREGLAPLRPFAPEEARAVLAIADRWREKCLREADTRFVFPSDEFYLLAGRELPEDEAYEDYPQIDNGVGMLRLFAEEYCAAHAQLRLKARKSARVILATGVSAAPFFADLLQKYPVGNVRVEVRAIRNAFFGESVTVAGLVTGGDLIAQLSGARADAVLITRTMLRAGEEVFLDDTTLEQVVRALGMPVIPVDRPGDALVDALTEFSEG